MFSTLPKSNFNFLITFIMLSANAFNLVKSIILFWGTKIMLDEMVEFVFVHIENIGEMEKMLVSSIFFHSYNVFNRLLLQHR